MRLTQKSIKSSSLVLLENTHMKSMEKKIIIKLLGVLSQIHPHIPDPDNLMEEPYTTSGDYYRAIAAGMDEQKDLHYKISEILHNSDRLEEYFELSVQTDPE